MPIKSASKPKNNFKVQPCRFSLKNETKNIPSRSNLVGLDLTISIVSFNTKKLLSRCLTSIYQHTKNLKFEVIVVDNASIDGSAAMIAKKFPQVKLIKNKTNQWYTGANNQALNQANGKYFMILNSDIFLKTNAFKKLADYLKTHSRIGAVEPLQRYEDGRIALTGSAHNQIKTDLVALTGLHRFIKLKPKFKNRKLTYPSQVISDGAMLIRTQLFKKIHGYDEKYKLYYTENDLCQKIQALKFSTIHFGQAEVWHTVSASTDKTGWQKISKIYAADALTYYLKYDRQLSAWGLFLALKLNNLLILLKQNLLVIIILVIATILRFYRLPELMTFLPDQGKDYLTARDMVLSGKPALVGIASSVPWLKQGPFFIWMIALVFKLFGFNPVYPAFLTAILGVLTVYLIYKYSRSLIAALFMAVSPLAVVHSRLAYHISPIPLFSVLYLLAMQNLSVGWTFFLAGVLLQFELTTLPLTFLALLRFKKFSPYWLIPFIPKIIYDLTHGFTQTLGFGAWAGYRLVNFHKYGNPSVAIFEFWRKFVSWDQPIIAAVLGLLVLIGLFKNRLLLYFLLINFLGFFLHGAPSEAYFPVLFPVWAIGLALLKSKTIKILIVLVCFYNIYFLFSHNFITYGPALKEQINFLQSGANYDYLSWWLNYAKN